MVDMEDILAELGVRHIPIRRKATGFVYNNPYLGLFRPVYRHVVLTGSWYTSVDSKDLSACLRDLHIPVVYQDGRMVRGQEVLSQMIPNIGVGNEVVLTSDPRVYALAARRCQELVEV
ncbi:MAG: hypothetical protein Q7R96_03185 [Nanoarchaeota archaeon]|nr:hypothetical protein [Nanoarchaeota archaeon]